MCVCVLAGVCGDQADYATLSCVMLDSCGSQFDHVLLFFSCIHEV